MGPKKGKKKVVDAMKDAFADKVKTEEDSDATTPRTDASAVEEKKQEENYSEPSS